MHLLHLTSSITQTVSIMRSNLGRVHWQSSVGYQWGRDDFLSQGVKDISKLLEEVVSTTPIKTGSNAKGLFADYILGENSYRVAYGTNGFVVSFYPID